MMIAQQLRRIVADPLEEMAEAEAFEEYCHRAVVVVSAREAPGACTALLVDRKAWRANGAIAK